MCAEGIVCFAAGTVEAEGDALDAGLDEPVEIGLHEAGGGGGAEADVEAEFGGVAGDVERIGTHEGIAAGEDEHGGLEVGELLDEVEGLGTVQFVRAASGLGLGPAMAAGQGAGAGDFPEDQEGPLLEFVSLDSQRFCPDQSIHVGAGNEGRGRDFKAVAGADCAYSLIRGGRRKDIMVENRHIKWLY